MKDLSLQITLKGSGEQKIFPLHSRASEYFQGRNWHEFVSIGINDIDNIHLEQFTNTDCGMLWEIISGNYVEGQMTSDEINWAEEEEFAGCQLIWQILIDGKPATYAEIDQSLNCDYWLEISSSRQESSGFIPLHKEGGELDISDAIYQAAEVDHENGTEEDGTHYGQVLEAIEPILKRQVEFVKTTIDGIAYEFSLSRCAE